MRKALPLILFLLIGCPGKPTEAPRPWFPDDDPRWCEAACDHLRSLKGQDGEVGCIESRPVIHDQICQMDFECEAGKCVRARCTESCEEACDTTRAKCWVSVKSCAKAENC
jgi:hypothetical protein